MRLRVQSLALLSELRIQRVGVPVLAQWLTNLTRNHEVAGSVPALAQWHGFAVSCGVGCRRGSDPPVAVALA